MFGGVEDFFVAGVLGDLDLGADFAVDLDGHLEGVLNDEGVVEFGPGLMVEGRFGLASRMDGVDDCLTVVDGDFFGVGLGGLAAGVEFFG